MGDIGRSGGVGLIRDHFTYNINEENKNIATLVQGFGTHNVVEGDTISDSDCVGASSYSNFGLVFVEINNNDNNEGKCSDFINGDYLDYDFFYYGFDCSNITLLSEKFYNEFLNSKVSNVGINFLAYIIAGVLQAESNKEESLNDIGLYYGTVVKELDEDNNYIDININYGDNFYFTSGINLVNKEYIFKNDFNVEIIIKISKEQGIIIEVKDKGIVINIPLKEIENATNTLVYKLDDIHSEPWCE